MIAFLSLAVVLAVLPALFAVQSPAAVAFKNLEQINAKFIAKMTKPLNTTSGEYVHMHYFDVNDCGGEEIQYITYRTGTCVNNADGSSLLYTCNGGKFLIIFYVFGLR
jgi:hypothetical protein